MKHANILKNIQHLKEATYIMTTIKMKLTVSLDKVINIQKNKKNIIFKKKSDEHKNN
jgi:hypothetical protein